MTKDSTGATKRSTAAKGKKGQTRERGQEKEQLKEEVRGPGGESSASITIGIDLGDRTSQFCILDEAGTVIDEGRLTTTAESFRRRFGRLPAAVIAIEVGTHSPWVSRLLKQLGHEVLVANARKLRMIYDNRRKQDKVDARMLARVARMDRQLLAGIEHRPEQLAQHLSIVRSRDVLVRARTKLINHVRGAVKSSGSRVTRCASETFARTARGQLPAGAMRQALSPVLVTIELLTTQIRDLDAKVDELGQKTYPETKLLRQVPGVGPLIALVFVLTLQDPRRFAKSRTVGPYLGLVPALSQSGASDPQLRITKEGDELLRRLLVQAAQFILGPHGPDCDLRRFGLALAARGGKNAKKRAIVAVARKLAVLLHRLWKSGEVYEPLRLAPHPADDAIRPAAFDSVPPPGPPPQAARSLPGTERHGATPA